MNKTIPSLVMLGSAASLAAAETYVIDPAHTVVGFSVKHMMVTNTRGVFGDVKGTVVADPNDLANSGVEVTIGVASIDTRNADRDTHLRSADFFDVEKFPTMSFKSTKVEKRGEGYVATGQLTIKGVSKEIALPFTVSGPITDPWGSVRYGLEFEKVKINRKDFGLTWNNVMETGGLVVGEEVTIELEVELVKQKPQE
ncbi:MAG: polyisoprenoid-binding protein [Thermoanaerobaculaceae bacterium]|nr:polyisoprenoid-binding protein [Thermoanaerobaculaceae bacterium]MDI9622219.1 YceI family protein [Acidobacteriota bacterium]NLH12588.1 polyisoprenoid-binding protein [Holophagae bacterium]HPW54942.1 YceI family protein [Thermoanaerobaculaceae bacterium]